MPFNTLDQLRAALYTEHPHLAQLEEIEAADADSLSKLGTKAPKSAGKAKFARAFDDFYLTNPIARASKVMAECSATLSGPVLAQAAE